MLTIEQIAGLTPEERAAYDTQLGRKILTKILLPKLAIAGALILGGRAARKSS